MKEMTTRERQQTEAIKEEEAKRHTEPVDKEVGERRRNSVSYKT